MPAVNTQAAPPPIGSYAYLAASMTLVGLYVGLSPLLVAAFPVMLLAFLRFGIAALAMAHWLPRPTDASPLTRREQGLLFLQSLLGNFLFTLCALHGAWLAGAVSAGVLMAGIPACVALLSRVFLGEPLTKRVWAAAGCTAAAVTLLALHRQYGVAPATAAPAAAWTGATLGYLLLVAAVVCEASYVVIGKKLSARVSAKRVSAIINLWGLVLSTPLGLALAWHFDFSSITLGLWALLVAYALAASMVTVWLWMKGLEQVPAQQAGIFTVFLPLSAAAMGVVGLGEPWGGSHAAALGLALTAVWLVTQPAGARAVPSSPTNGPAGPMQPPREPGGS